MSVEVDSAGAGLPTAPELAEDLIDAWGSWGPTLSPACDRIAFVSDRSGSPCLWVQDLPASGEPVMIKVSDDPVLGVNWSADGAWLSCCLATNGGVRTQVWVVRPDGSDARRLAGSAEQHAELGPWTRSGHRLVVTIPGEQPEIPTMCYLADPATGELTPLASGDLISVLDLSVDEEFVIIRDGQRGKQFCVVVDRTDDQEYPLLPYPAIGATERAIIRPSPAGDHNPWVAYVVTDAGLPRRQLVAVPLGPQGSRGGSGVLSPRDDAELEALDADDSGRLLLLVWNVDGRSELELYHTWTGESRPIEGVPGSVISGPLLSRDGTTALFSIEGPERPRELWMLDVATVSWSRATDSPVMPDVRLVNPTLETLTARDGLRLSGWLYRVPGQDWPGPAMISLHGGPEGQERPTFNPQHQAMVAAGIAVFAPNIRGSSGSGRAFVHADDIHGRLDAFQDVLACREFLVSRGIADQDRIAITGRSYGGYLTLASLGFSPGTFTAGVDICGMSDMHTFFRDTEPWIAAAAVSKYGDPATDDTLLRAISPLHSAASIDVPLLVVHGELDTNVPRNESLQIVAALRKLGRPVEYLQLDGEGHEYRRADSRKILISYMLSFLTEALRVS